MESSDSSVCSDWDVVNHGEISDVMPAEPPVEMQLNGMNEEKECPPSGSGVEVLTEENINHHNEVLNEANVSHHNILSEANVSHLNEILSDHDEILIETNINDHEIVNETDVNNHNDSNSSSDIDVIEESAEEMHHSGILRSQIDLLSTALAERGPLVPSVAPAPIRNMADGWNNFLLTHRLQRNPQFKDILIVIFISIAVASTMHLRGAPEDKVRQMKEQVDELKKENTHLKDRVISKIEDDKLFQTLEEQINALKAENMKLSNSMEFLIVYLEEQAESLKNENKMKQDPYKKEIDRLKEQVNILRIDNDDLQQQLVRMRYSGYKLPFENAKEGSVKKDAKLDKKEDNKENSSDILIEEIEKLKNKLYSEVNDLKDWKETIDNLIKHLDEKENKGREDNFNNKKASGDEKSRKNKEDAHEKKNKEQFYEWSWKNFRGTLDSMKVPDMLAKYMNYNEKKVKDAFESVGKYFKKAQEKTRNMFKRYNDKGKNEVWDFLGTLRHKWDAVKDEFYETQSKEGPVPPKQEGEKFTSDASEKRYKFENEKRKNRQSPNLEHSDETFPAVDYLMKNPRMNNIVGMDPEWQAIFEKFLNDEVVFSEHGKKPEKSWMFRRAAVRSILREQEDNEDSTNWFLRRKKTTSEEESGLRKDEDNL